TLRGSRRRSWERHCTIRIVPDSAALAAFLLRAKRATYAAQGDDATVTPLIPGSKQLEYREGERLYRDVYVGLTTFAGLETVDDTGAPRWAMTYAGGLVAPADFPAVYAFLREALQRGDVAAPYRGPARHAGGERAVKTAWEGDLERFSGAVDIVRYRAVVYSMR